MKLGSGEELLTVKDIAERIAFNRSEESVTRTLRQVRHWTQCDLLRTRSEKRTGKGIPRFYEEEPTLYVAAILYELTRYGVAVDIMKPVADELYEQWDEGTQPYFEGALTDNNSYLQVAWMVDPATGVFTGAELNFFDDIDRQSREGRLLDGPSSSVLINMNNVLQRVIGG